MTEEQPPAALGLAEPAGDPKELKKEAKRRAEAVRGLDARERYRALVDALEEGMDLVELADRKARFALMIMGALNVAFFFVTTRTDLVNDIPDALRPFLAFYLVIYAAVALFFFLEAIESLRPRRFRPDLTYPGQGGPEHFPEGLRYHEDVVMRDLEAYRRAWREVSFGKLNAELAVQNHIMARINQDKYRSLRRLYGGLRVLTVLAGGLLAIVALSMLLNGHRTGGEKAALALPPFPGALTPSASADGGGPAAVPAAGRETATPGAGLPAPHPVAVAGLREASGVAWDVRRERLYVVGDRGTLVEMRTSGEVTNRWPVRGNLEDVAVHAPSGRLVLLAEKKGEIVVFDPAQGRETGRFTLDVDAVAGRATGGSNQGFEGLSFREETGRPGGGVFFLVHQRQPARLVAIAFDPLSTPRTLGAADVLGRHGLKKWDDLTAVAWCEPLGRILVIAESQDRLLVLTPDGEIEGAFPLPGAQQEGLATLPDGSLWVADDRLGLLRFDGAVGWLREALARGGSGGTKRGATP